MEIAARKKLDSRYGFGILDGFLGLYEDFNRTFPGEK